MAHTDTVNSLNETLTHSLLFVGWRVDTKLTMDEHIAKAIAKGFKACLSL
jgi:hypothetical protein